MHNFPVTAESPTLNKTTDLKLPWELSSGVDLHKREEHMSKNQYLIRRPLALASIVDCNFTKMKKILVLLLLATPIRGFSQTYYEFPTDSAIWSHSYYGLIGTTLGLCGTTRHYGIFGDTIIQGTNYSKLYGVNHYDTIPHIYIPGFDIEYAQYVGGFRSDTSQKVYFIEANDSTEYLFFDFSLTVGDTFCFGYIYPPSGCLWVVSIDSQLIDNGEYRPSINFSNGLYKWVEGIGYWSLEGNTPPSGTDFFGNLIYGYVTFNCHKSKGEYLVGAVNQCTCISGAYYPPINWLDIEKVNLNTVAVTIYPNPATEKVSVDIGRNCSQCIITIHDIVGVKIFKSLPISASLKEIDIRSFRSGIYIVTIEMKHI